MDNLQGGTLALEHRYDVLERSDRHGFITLYHGRQDPFGKKVWVKAYDGLFDAGAGVELFDRLKEASQIASSLDDDGVLRIIDYGELEGGIPFVISERVDGEPLGRLLAREGTLGAEATSMLIKRLAQTLERAHSHGITHGSISPRWIYVDGERFDEAMLGHFQLALTVREILDTESAVMTADAVSAFPPEMFADADEEAKLEGFSPAGDVWALGVLAYIALVGVHPFFEEGLDASDGILRLRNEQARPLSELGVDPQISNVVERALQKEPEARFATVSAFADAFTQAVAPSDDDDESSQQISTPDASRTVDGPVEVDGTRRTLDDPAERQPGPSDRLMTLVIVLLVLSNLAWLFYVTGTKAEPTTSQSSANKPSATSVLTDG